MTDADFDALKRKAKYGSTFESLRAVRQLVELSRSHPESDHNGGEAEIDEVKREIAQLKARLEQAEARLAAKE
jgi:uncharacterized protein YceH (UPF0502 family)